MDRKILNLIIITLIIFIITAGLVIYRLADMQKEPEKAVPAKTEDVTGEKVVYTELNDPVEGDFKVHKSENGYSVKYPADMQAKSMAKSVDFILEDEQSGSSLNIVTAKNDGTLQKMTREEFEYSLSHMSADATLLSYKEIDINGIEAVEAVFTYMGNETKQVIIIMEDFGYNISVSKSVYITDEMSRIYDDIVYSFSLD